MADELEVFEKNVKAIFEDMAALLVSKRRSYGPSNLDDFGGLGCLIMAQSKQARLKTMYKNGTKHNDDGDSMLDAWRDLIGYAVLAILMEQDEIAKIKGQFSKLESDQINQMIGDSRLPVEYTVSEADGVKYLIGNPKVDVDTSAMNSVDLDYEAAMAAAHIAPVEDDTIIEPKSIQQAWPSEHNPKAKFKGSTIEEMLSWAEHTDPEKSFVMHECASCGNRSFLIDNLPYECHPFARKVTVAQNIRMENV